MQKFNMITSEGHILLDYDGNNYVIDTGSPASFSFEREEPLLLNGRDYPLQQGMLGVNQQDIETLVGVPVAGFIGLDILINLGSITFLWKDSSILLGDTGTGDDAVRLPIIYDPMHITIQMTVNGNDVSMLFDTGAKIDYLDSEYLDLTNPIQTETDFNPLLGEMEVTGYETIYKFGENEYTTITYEQPAMLGMLIGMLGVSGIVGMNAFTLAGNAVTINFETSMIEILK